MRDIAASIEHALGLSLHAQPAARVHGGCINECYRWESSAGPLFVKIADAGGRAVFMAEARGLEELARAHAVRIPQVLGVGASESHSWLVLEWIQFGAIGPACEVALGERLAQQHRVSCDTFGFDGDNTIGSTRQPNPRDADWIRFFREHRLRYQLKLARDNGCIGLLQQRGERLLECMGALFTGYAPAPSLLHGDLWGGNWSADSAGAPVLFDPAVYYGDREADIAMTHLFGGFGRDFYAAYESAWPLADGARVRVGLYNLYHVLNHLNLFGDGYLGQAQGLIDTSLAELGC
ncbi:MAG TPA: fructosamine kinase family protein [Steroidobacteraceae bacterium]|jgi:fructosamine-3-kinase